MAHKKNKMYQLACAKHFEVTHPGAAKTEGVDLDGVGNHPNAWFNSSVQYWKNKEPAKVSEGIKIGRGEKRRAERISWRQNWDPRPLFWV